MAWKAWARPWEIDQALVEFCAHSGSGRQSMQSIVLSDGVQVVGGGAGQKKRKLVVVWQDGYRKSAGGVPAGRDAAGKAQNGAGDSKRRRSPLCGWVRHSRLACRHRRSWAARASGLAEAVAEQRMADGEHVHAQLVRTAGDRRQLDPAPAFMTLDHAQKVRGVAAVLEVHHVTRLGRRVVAQRQFDAPAVQFRQAPARAV